MVDVRAVEPDEEWGLTDEERDEFQYVTTGGLRVRIQGVWYRYRRPLLGELNELHAALEAIEDELQTMTDPIGERAAALGEKAKALETSENREADTAVFVAEAAQIKRDQEKAWREVEARSAELREQWWRTVFKKLKPRQLTQKAPPSPAWVVDKGLPVQVVQHWMKVPKAPGQPPAPAVTPSQTSPGEPGG